MAASNRIRWRRRLAPALAVAGLALLVCGCDEEAPPAPQPPAETEYVFHSDQYLNNRFFRLDLPGRDEPGREAPLQRIRFNSIHIFQLLPPQSAPLPADIAYLAAYADSTGVFWNTPGCPPNDFRSPSVYGSHWREIALFDPVPDTYGNLVEIDLRAELPDSVVLAVCYEVENHDGALLINVGDVLYDPPTTSLPGEEHLYYRAKLLKAPVTTAAYPFHYVTRNVYSLGWANIDYGSFRMSIEANDPFGDPSLDERGIPYIRVFGLDRRTMFGGATPDGLVDLHDGMVFNLAKGLLRFPMENPFAAGQETYTAFADSSSFQWDGTFLKDHQAHRLYEPGTPAGDFPQYRHFTMKAVQRVAPE